MHGYDSPYANEGGLAELVYEFVNARTGVSLTSSIGLRKLLNSCEVVALSKK